MGRLYSPSLFPRQAFGERPFLSRRLPGGASGFEPMAIAGALRSGAIRSLRRSTRAACSRHAPSRSRSTPRLRCSLLARRPPQRSRRHEVDGSRRRGEIVSAFGAGEEVEEATDGGPQTVTPVSASAWRGSSIAMSGVASRRARIARVSRCWRFSRENEDGKGRGRGSAADHARLRTVTF
jgi:hypothetical protein